MPVFLWQCSPREKQKRTFHFWKREILHKREGDAHVLIPHLSPSFRFFELLDSHRFPEKIANSGIETGNPGPVWFSLFIFYLPTHSDFPERKRLIWPIDYTFFSRLCYVPPSPTHQERGRQNIFFSQKGKHRVGRTKKSLVLCVAHIHS